MKKTTKLGIFIQLNGAQLESFLRHKEQVNIKANSEMARKLILDQLAAIAEAAKTPRQTTTQPT